MKGGELASGHVDRPLKEVDAGNAVWHGSLNYMAFSPVSHPASRNEPPKWDGCTRMAEIESLLARNP
jgi:hypothetical protein